MRVYWTQRLYVRIYVSVLASLVMFGLLFWVAWHQHTHDGWFRLGLVIAIIVFGVAIGALPVARRLTRRLERLQASVDSFGAGQLSSRVPVEGDDEVASLARSFNASAEQIEALMLAQKRLLSNASHELRSPLTRIRMAIELLQEQAPPELRRELIRNIAELDQLVDEILLASRLDALSVAAPSMEQLDFTALVAEECAAVDAQLQAQAVSLRGDVRLLRRMVRNLLENARRYGGEAPIVVRLAINAGQQIQLNVLDSGPGIPAEERENIFAPFYRLPGASEHAGGVGLGLSLVRQIAGAHGGSAHCVAPDHSGCRFQILLPMQ